MFSKISAQTFFKVLNASTIGYRSNSKTIRLMSLNSSHNIEDPLMSNVDRLQRKARKKPSSVFNPAETTQLNIPSERKEFLALFPDVLKDVSELVDNLSKDKDLVDRIIRSMKYNVPNGRQIYSMSLIVTYKTLVGAAHVTPVNMKMIRLLGWILEMLAGTIFVVDDIIDNGKTRRNQPCWYLVEDVKLRAINDVLIIENLAYYVLRKYFSHLPYYPKLFEEYHKLYFITMSGQEIDVIFSRKGVQHFTMNNFRKLSNLKMSYLACCTPFALATKFVGIDNPELYRQTKPIFHEIGMYKQVQNDFYKCFVDTSELRKINTDIEDGQCTWLAIKCMEVATPAQRKIMEECYGKQDSEKAKVVKQLYDEFKIPELYYKYENETYN